MSSGLYMAVSGHIMQERRLEILANNLANVSTSGFKQDRPHFGAIYPQRNAAAAWGQGDAKLLFLSQKMSMSYPALSGITTDFSAGEIQRTGNNLDIAINGSGFFAVNTPAGELYTRSGNFLLNGNKELITQSGYPLKGKDTHTTTEGKARGIIIEGKDIAVDGNGAISVDGQEIDCLKVVDFNDYSGLIKVGNNLFKNIKGAANERKADGCEIQHQCLERSNIDIVQEMVKMIDVARICESYQKVIRAIDETDAHATREVAAVA